MDVVLLDEITQIVDDNTNKLVNISNNNTNMITNLLSPVSNKESLANLLYIIELSTFGDQGFVYNSKEVLEQLLASNVIKNSPIASSLYNEACTKQNISPAKYFKSLLNNTSNIFDSLNTIDSITSSQGAMDLILNNELTSTALLQNPIFRESFFKSTVGMQRFLNSELTYIKLKTLNLVSEMFSIPNSANIVLGNDTMIDKILNDNDFCAGLFKSSYGVNKICKNIKLYPIAMKGINYTNDLNITLNDATYFTKTNLGSSIKLPQVTVEDRYTTRTESVWENKLGYIFVQGMSCSAYTRSAGGSLSQGYTKSDGTKIREVVGKISSNDYKCGLTINKYCFNTITGFGNTSDKDPDGSVDHSESSSGDLIQYIAK